MSVPADILKNAIPAERADIAARRAQANSGYADAGARAQAEEDKRRQGVDESMAEPLPQQAPTEFPKPLPPVSANDYQALSVAIMGLASIAGGSKGGWMGASQALNGSMQGFMKGNQEVAEEQYKNYEREFQDALAKERQANKRFEDILRDRNLTTNQRIAAWRVAAAETGRLSATHVAEMRSIDEMERNLNSYQTALERVQQHYDDASEFDENTKQILAEKYLATGQLPAMGYGNAGVKRRDSVFKKVSELAGERGLSGYDLASMQAGFHANQGSLTALTKQYDAVTAFEKNAIRNGDRLMQLADKVDATGVPALERWIRGGRKATGDADVANFNAQMQVYRTEAAKILTNPNLTGQLTDSARHEVEEFLSGNSSAEQIRAVVELLKNDFENRKVTLESQIQEARSRITSGAAPGGRAPATSQRPTTNSKGWTLHRDEENNSYAYVSPDGTQFEEVQ